MYSTNNYLIKRGISAPWKIHPTFKQKFSHAMVIPCLNEYEHLPVLLKSIEKNGRYDFLINIRNISDL